jgi:hypothetical protein
MNKTSFQFILLFSNATIFLYRSGFESTIALPTERSQTSTKRYILHQNRLPSPSGTKRRDPLFLYHLNRPALSGYPIRTGYHRKAGQKVHRAFLYHLNRPALSG